MTQSHRVHKPSNEEKARREAVVHHIRHTHAWIRVVDGDAGAMLTAMLWVYTYATTHYGRTGEVWKTPSDIAIDAGAQVRHILKAKKAEFELARLTFLEALALAEAELTGTLAA